MNGKTTPVTNLKRLARLAGIFLLGAALLPAAFAADLVPNQPGVLTPAEIREATEVMKSQLGGEPALPLVASGRRGAEHVMPRYALFAGPLSDFSDRIRIRRQVICNFFRPMGKWQCTKPQTEFRMTAQGIAHVFPYIVETGPEDKQTAVDIADHMYSSCFAIRFKALGGNEPAPLFNLFPINTVVSRGSAFTVMTGPDEGGDVYQLEKTDRKADGCGFRIVSVRMNKAALVLPEGHAKAMAKQEAQDRERLAAEQRSREEQARSQAATAAEAGTGVREIVAGAAMWAAMILGLMAIIAPRFVLAKGRWVAARRAGFLAAACTVMAVISAIFMPDKYNIRIDLLINGTLLLLAWLNFAGLMVWAAVGGKENE